MNSPKVSFPLLDCQEDSIKLVSNCLACIFLEGGSACLREGSTFAKWFILFPTFCASSVGGELGVDDVRKGVLKQKMSRVLGA